MWTVLPAGSVTAMRPLTAGAHVVLAVRNVEKGAAARDQILRLLVGLVLIALTLSGQIGVWGWIGVLPIATALMNWCPAYTLLGVRTCPVEPK